MRLATLKIQGFKSFADPVSFNADGSLIGVVGPNGCGKSNIVDAIRWALGESRASSLRGSSLPDILFNGNAKRAAADWCRVDLRFDNANADAPGMWSACSEIVVRRELERNGEQGYFINDSAVRRRDVVDLFRGTGVAPRAYGVIEQGMVSQIADSSPDELRAFMEEAAGVSHYKERRRESERRLQAGRDNLEQVAIILDGLGKRADSLKRQARKARRYRELSEAINALDALLVAERRGIAESDLIKRRDVIAALENQGETLRATLSSIKRTADGNRQQREDRQAAADLAQQGLADARAAFSAAERDSENAVAKRKLAGNRLADSERELAALIERISEIDDDERQLAAQAAAMQRDIDAAAAALAAQASELAKRRETCQHKSRALDAARQALSASTREHETQTLKAQMLDERLAALGKRVSEAETALANMPLEEDGADAGADLREHEHRVNDGEKLLREIKRQREESSGKLSEAESLSQALENGLAMLKTEMKTLREMMTEEDGSDDSPPRLAHVLRVNAGDWARALDAALGVYANATVVDDLANFFRQGKPPASGDAVIELKETPAAPTGDAGLPTLLSALELSASSRAVLSGWLSGFYVADSETEAVAASRRLQFGEHIVTRSGGVYGARSFFAHGDTRGGYNWEQRMSDLSAAAKRKEANLEAARDACRAARKEAEDIAAREEAAVAALNDSRRLLMERNVAWNRLQERNSANALRRREIAESRRTMQDERRAVEAEKSAAADNIAVLAKTRDDMEERFFIAQSELAEASRFLEICRQERDKAEQEARRLELKRAEINRRQIDVAMRSREAATGRERLEERSQACQEELSAADESALEKTLGERRQRLQEAESAAAASRRLLQDSGEKRDELERQLETAREELEATLRRIGEEKIGERELSMTVAHCVDALEELGLASAQAAEMLAAREGESGEQWRAEIDDKRSKREQLGAMNFMADAELRECEDRVAKTAAQKQDVESAIAELEGAIQRIDRETKKRLRDMFDGVNREFGGMFRRLFGGGEARLEMDGDSILDAGFFLRAQPPGKRLFAVRMLSGGEKAAAALAFVFSILRLNPPPFCVLDEVDAPLDDHRAERFSALLRDISKEAQLLVITHNKGTIAAIPKLIGVTQEEPGVSKIVTAKLEDGLRDQ